MSCPRCVAGLDHCHGVLLVHVVAPAECTEPRCVDQDPARHVERVDCAVLADCGCDLAEAPLLRQAS
jgi:hypothetical protein